MRRWIILAVAAAQVALLAYMAGQREFVLNTGRTVWLRTAPVDPNDPMRGAYVSLRYEVSRVPRELCRAGVATWMDELRKTDADWQVRRRREAAWRDHEVYAVLREGADGLAELTALTDRRPAAGLYLRGRVSWADAESVSVRYGIEALFLQQEKAKFLETDAARRARESGVRLDAEVVVSGSGLAVLKGSRWEPLGITLEVETGTPAPAVSSATPNTTAQSPVIDLSSKPLRRGRRVADPARAIVAVTVELKNHGEKPLAIWAPGDGRAFRLVPQKNWSDSLCRWVGDGIIPAKPEAGEIAILKPGESRKVRIDLTALVWALRYRDDAKAEELTTTVPGLEEMEVPEWSFRIEYTPLPAADCAGLPGAELLWQRSLRTRAFSPTSVRGD
jgi:uncharacterized membrane-anchored protein